MISASNLAASRIKEENNSKGAQIGVQKWDASDPRFYAMLARPMSGLF
jgi:hypothetical protein